MEVRFTEHASVVMVERHLHQDWVERAILHPEKVARDPRDPFVIRSYKRIPEAGGRVLRVVHRPEGDDMVVITAFFDRRASL